MNVPYKSGLKRSNRCLYHSTFADFLSTPSESILGMLVEQTHGKLEDTSTEAWQEEIRILQNVLKEWEHDDAYIIFEYDIPRLGKRIDVVLLLRGLIFCLEFKVRKDTVLAMDKDQVLDYALDLKNFHLYSSEKRIVPILIPTNYKKHTSAIQPSVYHNEIYNPFVTGEQSLKQVITTVLNDTPTANYSADTWGNNWLISPYAPTPTIIEAARTLYNNHTVENITRHGADEVDTDNTIQCVLDIIQKTKDKGEKSICFVTGVPGAGKTLVGLQVAFELAQKEDNNKKHAVYLSGNGPLVAVLTEALAKDDARRNHKNITDSRREVSSSINIIHRYRDNMLAKIVNPVQNGKLEIDPSKAKKLEVAGYGEVENVAIFDEAQRAWTQQRIAAYLKKGGTYGNKLKVPNFPVSEADFLIWSLDHREDWAVIICLVGGGQEIHTGEAGIAEWISALNDHYPHWNVYISNKLTAPEYAEGKVNELLKDNKKVTFCDKLHLAVSLRTFRAAKLSDFVHQLLAIDTNSQELYKEITQQKYPIFLTRDINSARAWLRKQAIGSTRTGILVSKAAARYKPQAVNVLERGDINAVHWFLEDKMDIRSSNFLEDAATEIEVQGLELDFTCVLWDADMRYENGTWKFYKFDGKKKWGNEPNEDTRNYMLNAYRVLLTRARQGMVICVPEGSTDDPTRQPAFYDGTYEYLKSLGIKKI